MKRIDTLRAVALGLLLVGSIFAARAQNEAGRGIAEPMARKNAKSTFESVCAACHGLDGRGGERGPDLVSRRESVAKTDSDLLGVIREGRTSKGMPAFQAFGEKQLVALVAYLRELQGAGRQTSSSGDPARGRKLFFGKAKCSECHMVGGQGGFFASELTSFAGKKSADELRTAILSPEKGRDPRKGPVTVELADGTVLKGIPRNEDNFSMQLQTPDGLFHLIKKADIVSQERLGNSETFGDHGRALSTGELNNLVDFLTQSSGLQNAGNPKNNTDDDEE